MQVASEAIKSFLLAVEPIIQQQAEEHNQQRKSEKLEKRLQKELISLTEMEKKVEGDVNYMLSPNHPLSVKSAKTEALKERVDTEKAKHLNSVQESKAMILNGLKTILPNVFQALMGFSKTCVQAFEAIHSRSQPEEPQAKDITIIADNSLPWKPNANKSEQAFLSEILPSQHRSCYGKRSNFAKLFSALSWKQSSKSLKLESDDFQQGSSEPSKPQQSRRSHAARSHSGVEKLHDKGYIATEIKTKSRVGGSMHLFKGLLDGAARKQHITTLEDAIDADLEANLHIEEVELGISPPNEEGEDDEEEMAM
ncbi:auxin-induced protein 5NG4-like [Hibiscus syriacus]|uniref:Auxin-induced protein 5NG4-like n=1 Tax=Hibiscus syriacus TaxID=106335 RepID=A0A6A3C7N3_HIBSY|nr:auxin-induced protein 5NG4-like [Hibiscus syriacus]